MLVVELFNEFAIHTLLLDELFLELVHFFRIGLLSFSIDGLFFVELGFEKKVGLFGLSVHLSQILKSALGFFCCFFGESNLLFTLITQLSTQRFHRLMICLGLLFDLAHEVVSGELCFLQNQSVSLAKLHPFLKSSIVDFLDFDFIIASHCLNLF
jgi:hypothetical protein